MLYLIKEMAMIKQKYIEFDSKMGELICTGEWTISTLSEIKKIFEKVSFQDIKSITVNGKAITKMDSAGAFFLTKWLNILSDSKLKIFFDSFSIENKNLLLFSEEQKKPENIPAIKVLNWLQALGKYFLTQADEIFEFINFVGLLFFESLKLLAHPTLWRWNTVASVINKTGTSALPIITLISFMTGVVITYQMGNELRKYGANVFIVNLVGFSILREFGPLLTAIMIAGRTGSAFTAQLGLMKINQELDAINIMGITSAELLLLPRLIGLVIVVPLLTIWADMFGVLGGMLMSKNVLGVMPHDFIIRFTHEIPLRALLIGLGKAPVFALIIASVSCFQGIKVHGSSESVGMRTTRSVVLSIFLIIVVDGIFSIILSNFKL